MSGAWQDTQARLRGLRTSLSQVSEIAAMCEQRGAPPPTAVATDALVWATYFGGLWAHIDVSHADGRVRLAIMDSNRFRFDRTVTNLAELPEALDQFTAALAAEGFTK